MLNKHKHITVFKLQDATESSISYWLFFFQATKRCPLSVWYYLTGSGTEQASCEHQLNPTERLRDGAVF